MTVDYPDDMPVSQQMLAAYFGVSTQVAALIATGEANGGPGGVPLLNWGNLVASYDNAALTTAGVGLPSSGTYPISQIGYEGILGLNNTTLAGLAYLILTMTWYIGGVQVDKNVYYIACPQSGGSNVVRFRGPTRGTSVSISLVASGNTISLDLFEFLQTSRVYNTDQWYSSFLSGPFGGFANVAPIDSYAGTLAAITASIAASTTTSWLLPLYNGRAALNAQTLSGTTDLAISVTNATDPNITAGFPYEAVSDATGRVYQPALYLPRAQCQLNLRNNNAGVQTVTCQLIAAEY